MKIQLLALLMLLVLLASCRKEARVIEPVETGLQPPDPASALKGFYLLNEGNMGSNKCTLDYFDYATGKYNENIYGKANPTVVKELGDVGNDIHVYGGKLYAVINVSNKVEVLDVSTARRIAQINIPNCRYITFYGGKAYVSSYAGPVQLDPNAQIGYVAEIDTATLKVTRQVTVGYQPEEMAVVHNKLYVANSGGYRFPNYDRTVSVIELSSFMEIKKIDVAINLHRLKADSEGDLYVTSRGDYYNTPSNLYVIDTRTDRVKDTLQIPASNICITGDSAYVYSVEWNWNTQANTVSYAIVNTRTEQLVTRNFITDGTEKNIRIPYGIAVNPLTQDIYVTDAKDYVSPGTLYCFDKTGKKKWSVVTGDIPAHMAFVWK
ncbi:DNA-binding beta-propeller fold protein YncE [Filimonas zeae]|uniref:YncE family protein n=1 Tax=Filimonas zeae TaxID=1737353 RepID=A0A917IR65_9BACT|nr:YncE family protein [Filimonas zeae]MDR6337758.1 DNA-binding beta-propeller fold protein YncE [Filimonas zeae]GGH60132.1 hypothetical protein GCM10011379_07640 [Filimonas zeae]